MNRQIGKIPRATLERVILPRIGAVRREVIIGPRHGVDVGVVDLGEGRVMALTTDPFYVMPEVGWERAGWFAVQIVASDAATSGLAPRYMTVDLNLPPDMEDSALEILWESVAGACRDLGIVVVTGHTGRYDGCSFPMVGAATAVCIGSADEYVTPDMARPGDVLVVTKGAAIETGATFGAVLGPWLQRELGAETAAALEQLFWRQTVVPDALVAASAGVRERGVTALHDATEGGVWNGLREIAEAAGAGMVVQADEIPVLPEVQALCDRLGIDPLPASSEGTLLIACRPDRVRQLQERLAAADIPAACVGELLPADAGMTAVRSGRSEPMESLLDPFWPAFAAAMRREDLW